MKTEVDFLEKEILEHNIVNIEVFQGLKGNKRKYNKMKKRLKDINENGKEK